MSSFVTSHTHVVKGKKLPISSSRCVSVVCLAVKQKKNTESLWLLAFYSRYSAFETRRFSLTRRQVRRSLFERFDVRVVLVCMSYVPTCTCSKFIDFGDA